MERELTVRHVFVGFVEGRNLGRDRFNQNSNRSDRENWSTSKGGPVFSKLFRLDQTDPLSFGPKCPEILVEWIAPLEFGVRNPECGIRNPFNVTYWSILYSFMLSLLAETQFALQ